MGEFVRSQYGATETLNAVEQELESFLDLDDLAAALRKSSTEPIDIATFERERSFSQFDDSATPTFYGKRDVADSGVSVTPVSNYATTHARLAYPTFRKCEELQPRAANIALRGVRAAVLLALQGENPGPKTIIAPGNAYTLAATITARQLRAAGLPKDQLQVVSAPSYTVTRSMQQQLEKHGVAVLPPHPTIEDAIGAARMQAQKQPGAILIDPRDNPALLAGQATAFLEFFAQLKAQGIDTRRHRVNLRVPLEQGTTFIGAAVVWRWLKEQDMLTRGSNLIAVQAENNDAVARTLEESASLVLGNEGSGQLDLKAFPTGALTTGSRIMSVINEWADDIQIVPPKYLVKACASAANPNRPLPGLSEVLSQAAVLMDAEEGRLDQSVPELTIMKGLSPRQDFLAETITPYTSHDAGAVAQAATSILKVLQARLEARRQDSAGTKAPADATPTVLETTKSASPLKQSSYKPSASESYARGLRVWRGSR